RVVWQGFPCCSSLWLRARALVAVRVNRKRRAAKTLPRSRGTQGRTTYPPREPNGPRGKSNKGWDATPGSPAVSLSNRRSVRDPFLVLRALKNPGGSPPSADEATALTLKRCAPQPSSRSINTAAAYPPRRSPKEGPACPLSTAPPPTAATSLPSRPGS